MAISSKIELTSLETISDTELINRRIRCIK